MSTTLFDLLWQLKRELEKSGGERVELPQLIDDPAYRQTVVARLASASVSPALKSLIPYLDTPGVLDIGQSLELPADHVDASLDAAQTTSSKKPAVVVKPKKRSTGLMLVFVVLVAVLAGIGLMGRELLSGFGEVPQRLVRDAEPAPVSRSVNAVAAAQPQADAAVAEPSVDTLFRLHGSNTIGESLAPALLEAFWEREGINDISLEQLEADVERDMLIRTEEGAEPQRIELKAHGSSTGFKGLAKQQADLAMASRRIKENERQALEPLYGDLSSVNAEHVIGMDGLAIIVHPENPLNSLATEQLAQLFSGEVSNWSELGGPDLPVVIYSRDSNSGTWDSFNSMVLKQHAATLSEEAIRLESSSELSERVSQEAGAIGFIGLPYVLRAKALAVADEVGALPVFPTSFTISTEDYPLTRRLYIYEPTNLPLDSVAHRFVEFIGSEEGQEVVRETGFVSQNIRRIQPALNEELPDEYLDIASGGSRLSLNFRFKSGTFVLDSKAQRDMSRVIRFFENNPGQSVVLIGFSDNVGESERNRQLSLQRAQIVRDELLARGINVVAVHGMGDQVPVASNETAAGRDRNRRVEVWVRGYNSGVALR
ncbi:substrate-binding domain-containing protein [Marinobacterium mangrovicola]|uniref:Phosphate ABC transporter substrate-binding protein (PhoT family) n=1 Tax=Marinobacterium mangrovicola TaxID=1476959 RepID=A0A4R1GIE4_9GAMM|nr:phosphate ABC transporter substrate-binding/OmpA family protein [Marinobacterium mangrovicola]TCK06891.1 phosphate ABC transporter substrate-binding protein (PhoT family) [Marinobacterium mangrovicola]